MKQFEFEIPVDTDARIRETTAEVLKDPRIQKMLDRTPGLRKHIEANPYIFKRWIANNETCRNCPGLWACPNVPKGYMETIEMTGSSVNNILQQCRWLAREENTVAHKKKYLICDLSDKELKYSIETTDISNEESDYVDVFNLVSDWIRHQPKQGLYLYGSFGTGKTYLAACITNRLAKQGTRVAFVNIPQFFTRCRNSIGADYSNPDARDYVDNSIDRLKRAEVVVLDDIGAENTTNWVRDDILLPVLDYRCANEKRTIFTSNLDLSELETKLAYNRSGHKDEIKAGRILSRIRAMAIPVEVPGNDRR